MSDSHQKPDRVRYVRRGTRLHRHIMTGLCMAGVTLQLGCYKTVPIAGNGKPAAPVILTVNERGRLALGSRLGSLLEHVEGRIVASDDAKVEIAVDKAVDVRGASVMWAGERAVVPRDGISSIVERKLSKRSTWALVGAIAAGVALFFVALNKRASGAPDLGDGGGINPI